MQKIAVGMQQNVVGMQQNVSWLHAIFVEVPQNVSQRQKIVVGMQQNVVWMQPNVSRMQTIVVGVQQDVEKQVWRGRSCLKYGLLRSGTSESEVTSL